MREEELYTKLFPEKARDDPERHRGTRITLVTFGPLGSKSDL
jgi:hypothetical protein